MQKLSDISESHPHHVGKCLWSPGLLRLPCQTVIIGWGIGHVRIYLRHEFMLDAPIYLCVWCVPVIAEVTYLHLLEFC